MIHNSVALAASGGGGGITYHIWLYPTNRYL